MGNYVYIVECSDGSWYTGWTNDLDKRLKAHNSGHGAKYTRSRRPVHFIYTEEFETSVEAQKREYAIKRLTREQKEEIVKTASCNHSGNVKQSEHQDRPQQAG